MNKMIAFYSSVSRGRLQLIKIIAEDDRISLYNL